MGWPFTDQIACLVEWLFVLLSLNGDGWSWLDAWNLRASVAVLLVSNDDEATGNDDDNDDNDRSAVSAGDANAARHENVIVVPLFTTCSRGASITVPENGVSINWGSVRAEDEVFPSVCTFLGCVVVGVVVDVGCYCRIAEAGPAHMWNEKWTSV